MALPFGKITFLVGAGILTSVLAKEGRLSSISDAVGGTWKIVSKLTKQGDAGPSDRKTHDDALLAQVKSVRQELSLLPNGPIIIQTTSGTGARKYGIIVVLVVVGYGYVWWKGWKLPNLMFATKRSLSDACNSVAKQLEDVYSSISASQRQLSSKITSVDQNANKITETLQATQEEVTILQGKSKSIYEQFQNAQDFIQSMQSKLERMEGKQNYTYEQVNELCTRAMEMRNGRSTEFIQNESLPALPLEPPSPSESNGYKVDRQNSISDSGLKELNGVQPAGESSRSPEISNGVGASGEFGSRSSSSNGVLTRWFSGSVLTRQRSASNGSALQALSSGQQC